ncbi:MAG TPA: LptF/LptG family permease [Candidatus Megaira endosymbiont of Hartmannula sinica]|nr:LptF/LptG family permease [Candidatus Megaera endosymbiont of Hartmannula sinica]
MKNLIKIVFVTIFVITSMVWITQIMRFLYLFEKNISFIDFFFIMVNLLPSLLFISLPLSFVIAVFILYFKMNQNKHTIIFQIHRLSNFTIAKPALAALLIITLITYIISIYLIPYSYAVLKNSLSYFKENYLIKSVEVDNFNSLSKHTTLYIGGKKDNNSLTNIILFDNSIKNNTIVFFAKDGKVITEKPDNNISNIIPESSLILKKGTKYVINNNGFNNLSFDKFKIKLSDTNNKNNFIDPLFNKKSITYLLFPEKYLPYKVRNKLIIEGYQRLTWPLLNIALIFIILSILLINTYNRSNNYSHIGKIAIHIIFTIVSYFSINKIAIININYIYINYLLILGTIFYHFYYMSVHKI